MKTNIINVLIIIQALVGGSVLQAQQWIVSPEQLQERTHMLYFKPVDGGTKVLGVGYRHEADNYFKTNGVVMKINEDGEVVCRDIHAPGMWLSYHCATELENGNYMVFGVCEDSLYDMHYGHYLRVDVFDPLLNPVLSRQYRVNDTLFGYFTMELSYSPMKSMLSDDGTVLLATSQLRDVDDGNRLCFYEFDSNGDTLRAKAPMEGALPSYGFGIYCVTKSPRTGDMQVFVYNGWFPGQGGEGTGFKTVDSNFEIKSIRSLFRLSGPEWWIDHIYDARTEGRWDEDCHMIVCAEMAHSNMGKYTIYHQKLYKIDTLGRKQGELQLQPFDSCMLAPDSWNMAYSNDSTIFVLSWCGENVYNNYKQLNVTLVDNNLNLLGRRVFKEENMEIGCGQPAVFDDGGCVFELRTRKGSLWYTSFMKMTRDDIEITWDVVDEHRPKMIGVAYPNPATDRLNIPVSGLVPGKTRLRISDISGAVFVDSRVNAAGNLISVDVSNLAPGTYVYQIVTDNNVHASSKFVKE